jgi:hypothetical protein
MMRRTNIKQEEDVMGDKGGKKDKLKSNKQKSTKQVQKSQSAQAKQSAQKKP